MRFLTLLPILLLAPSAFAHPLPNMRFDRTVHVKVESAGIVVRYVLELGEWTMAIDGQRLLTDADVAGLTGGQAYANKYGARKALFLADNLRGKFDGKPLAFAVKSIEAIPDREHLRFRFTLRAERPKDGAGRFTFEDQNFENAVGQISLTLEEANDRVNLTDIVEPTDLRGKASFQYQPGDDVRARRVEATIVSSVVETQLETALITEVSPVDETRGNGRLGWAALLVGVAVVALLLFRRTFRLKSRPSSTPVSPAP